MHERPKKRSLIVLTRLGVDTKHEILMSFWLYRVGVIDIKRAEFHRLVKQNDSKHSNIASNQNENNSQNNHSLYKMMF